jgi:tetratricopeptide (TPR) repeat protein
MKMKLMLVGLLAIANLALGQPKVKSKNEQEAVLAVFNAQTPDQKIAAVDNLIAKFKDTEFKAIALEQAAEAAQQKGDSINAILYGDRALEADPKNFQAMLLVSGQIAQTTQEFALDKDERLKRASKLANDAITTVNAAVKPNPQLTDEQWESIKKDLISQAHETLGVIAIVDKKYDQAVTELKMALDGAATPQAATMIRLAAAYNSAGKFDDGMAMADKLLATAGVPDNIKKMAQDEKQRAAKGKAGQK